LGWTWCFPPRDCLAYQQATLPSLHTGTSLDVLLICRSHAGGDPYPEAGARDEQRLEGVAWTPWRCGRWQGHSAHPLAPQPWSLPLYPFNAFFSSLKKRQSVPWAMIFCCDRRGTPTVRPYRCPPATAGIMAISSPSWTAVCAPCRKRISSLLT